MSYQISEITDSKQTSSNEERAHLPNGKGTDLQKLENLKFWTPHEKELPPQVEPLLAIHNFHYLKMTK